MKSVQLTVAALLPFDCFGFVLYSDETYPDRLKDAKHSIPTFYYQGRVDRYGRQVAEVSSPNGRVLNIEQIKSGNAYLYRQYASHCPHEPQMEHAESIAKQASVGVWKYADALKPWEYRKTQRQGK